MSVTIESETANSRWKHFSFYLMVAKVLKTVWSVSHSYLSVTSFQINICPECIFKHLIKPDELLEQSIQHPKQDQFL